MFPSFDSSVALDGRLFQWKANRVPFVSLGKPWGVAGNHRPEKQKQEFSIPYFILYRNARFRSLPA